MPPTCRRRSAVQAKDSTAPEACAGHQPLNRIRKVTLRVSEPDPSSTDTRTATPVPAPPPALAPPLAAGHPALVGSQYNARDPAMNIPTSNVHPYMPFYPPALPQLHYPPFPPYGAGAAHHDAQYTTLPTPILSQLLATQYANTTGLSSPASEVQSRAYGSVRGALAHIDVASSSAEARPGKTYPNKEVSPGGKTTYLRKERLADVLKCGISWWRSLDRKSVV